MKNLTRSIISLAMRMCGVIICSALLLKVPVTYSAKSPNCDCILIFILYLIICAVAMFYNCNSNEKSIVTCILSILLGIVLSIVAIYAGHLACAGAMLVANIVSIAVEY